MLKVLTIIFFILLIHGGLFREYWSSEILEWCRNHCPWPFQYSIFQHSNTSCMVVCIFLKCLEGQITGTPAGMPLANTSPGFLRSWFSKKRKFRPTLKPHPHISQKTTPYILEGQRPYIPLGLSKSMHKGHDILMDNNLRHSNNHCLY